MVDYALVKTNESGFNIRSVEYKGQKWYIARDLFSALKLRTSITKVMRHISIKDKMQGLLQENPRMYLLNENGCKDLIQLYKSLSSRELEAFLKNKIFLENNKTSEKISLVKLEQAVKRNENKISDLESSINEILEFLNRNSDIMNKPAEEKKKILRPQKRKDWRRWCNCIVKKLVIKRGGNESEGARTIWNALVAPIEKQCGVDFWKLVNEASDLSKKKKVSRISIIDSNDAWMEMLVEGVCAMAVNANVSLNIYGIPMEEYSQIKNISA